MGAAPPLKYTGPAVGGADKTGWVDILTGVTARKRADGEYLVFVEEDYRAKAILYLWKPQQTIPANRSGSTRILDVCRSPCPS